MYVRSNGVWSEQQKLTASDGAQDDSFGSSVSYGSVIGLYWCYGNAWTKDQPMFMIHLIDTPATILGDISKTTEQGGSTTGTLVATDVDGLTDGSYFTISTPPVHGQAIINPSSGSWVYLGNPTYAGLDPFTVTVTDDLAVLPNRL